jgi:electron transfer flavoprotein beta subunit
MKIAVCLKQVAARDWQPRVDERGSWIQEHDAGFQLNESDGYALEQGLRLRDAHGGDVLVCSAGPARAAQVLREALARGADRAVHVRDDQTAAADPFAVATVLAEALRTEDPDLILTGSQSDDQGFGQTGVILAELLGLPHSTLVSEVQVTGDGGVRARRELEGGWCQWVWMPLPALLAVQTGAHPLRYATLKGIMAAKKKELRTVSPASVPVPRQRLVSLSVPVRTRKALMIEGSPAEVARELVSRLKERSLVRP